ncbi:MAG: efflux RND transporter periplasmic adaptor subunit [Thermoguttaceae bacterium]
MLKAHLLSVASLVLVAASLVIAGCGRTAGTDKPKEAPRVTVAHPAVRSLVDEDDYNGWLEAYRTVEVRARVRGHIKKVYFKDGDIVQVGQPLFDLDPAPFEAEVKQAEAQARAYEAQKIAAVRDVARYTALLQTGGASKQQLDKTQADADSYDAQIAAKKAEVARYQLDLNYAKITADLAGKIGKAALTEGNLVNAGGSDPLLTTIVSVDPIYVDFNIDERAMQRYQEAGAARQGKGERVSLRDQKLPFSFGLDTEKGFPHEGQLVFADNKYSAGTGTILVRGVAKNPDGRLIPGSRVRVRVPVSDKFEAVMVPDSALLADQDRRYLLVLGKDNMVLRRDITPGRLLDDGMRVILPAPGEEQAADTKARIVNWEKEWVITVGLQRARINYPVQPLGADGQPIAATGAAQ